MNPFARSKTGDRRPSQPSSIDRFFWSKGAKFYSSAIDNLAVAVGILTMILVMTTVVLAVIGVMTAGPSLWWAIISGLGTALSAKAMHTVIQRGSRRPQLKVTISESGRKMLSRIGAHIRWIDADQVPGRKKTPFTMWWRSTFGIKTASDVLKPKSAELLEAGSVQFNRLTGLLKLAKDSQVPSSSLAPQIQVAADEAMKLLINQVGLLEESPGEIQPIVSQSEIQIESLKELADRFEASINDRTSVTDRLGASLAIGSALDQLKMEAQAREELRIMDRQE